MQGLVQGQNQTRFRTSQCEGLAGENHRRAGLAERLCRDLYLQYSHLYATYELLRRHEREQRRAYHFVAKARNDLVYRDGDVLDPGWLPSTHHCRQLGLQHVRAPSSRTYCQLTVARSVL